MNTRRLIVGLVVVTLMPLRVEAQSVPPEIDRGMILDAAEQEKRLGNKELRFDPNEAEFRPTSTKASPEFLRHLPADEAAEVQKRRDGPFVPLDGQFEPAPFTKQTTLERATGIQNETIRHGLVIIAGAAALAAILLAFYRRTIRTHHEQGGSRG